MTHTQKVQRSVGSKDRLEWKQTDGLTDASACHNLPG